jgi:hypothetical protein
MKPEDYAKTIRHCKKALEFNSADDTAKEYLWLALLHIWKRDRS